MVCEDTGPKGYVFGRITMISDLVKQCYRLGDIAFLACSDGLYLLEARVNGLNHISNNGDALGLTKLLKNSK
jgi:hypothetical protein